MVYATEQRNTYRHAWDLVVTSFWTKYEGHRMVRNVTLVDRKIDDLGRLVTRRVLTAGGTLPLAIKKFLPEKYQGLRGFEVLETTVCDPQNGVMTVETRTLSMPTLFNSVGNSIYLRDEHNKDQTNYRLDYSITAHKGGRAAQLFEKWLGPRLAGNAKDGQAIVDKYCEKMRAPLAARQDAGRAPATPNPQTQ